MLNGMSNSLISDGLIVMDVPIEVQVAMDKIAEDHLIRLEYRDPNNLAFSLPTAPGIYQLYMHLPQPVRLQVGRLGTFDFPAGLYVYTGSALGGIGPRVGRHLRKEKRFHWHIDFLREHARVHAVTILITRERWECTLHRQTMESLEGCSPARGFGSSDCSCLSHLGYLGELLSARALVDDIRKIHQ